MRILAAQLFQFRNVSSAQITFSPRLTAFIGPNGQGKTNLLEALYTVAALRPLRSVPRSELIQADRESAFVEVTVQTSRTGLTHQLRLDLRRGGRVLSKDGKKTEAGAFLGHFVAVAFTPDDLEISKGSPEVRRRFLDRAVLNTRPAYLAIALRYARALKARNRLLAEAKGDDLLDAYDRALATAGAAVLSARARYVAEVAPRIVECFRSIAAPAPELSVKHKTSIVCAPETPEPTIEAALYEKLLHRRAHDRRRVMTSVGPHLDDLVLTMDGVTSRLRASQGQHRALVLALKIAEIEHLTATIGEAPVLLLDDISSELDAGRTRQLFARLAPLDAQVVLTTTDPAQVPHAVSPLRYAVRSGLVEPFSSA